MKRLTIILLFAAIMLAVIVISMNSIAASKEAANTQVEQVPLQGEYIPSEAMTFAREDMALRYKDMPIDESKSRSMEDYYANRAYHGAPPTIPHPVADERSMGQNTCLKCHNNGGYVAKWDAYAPVVPHPDMVNCRQCHVFNNKETVDIGDFSRTNPMADEK